MLWESSPFH